MGYKKETSTVISDFALSSCCYIAGSLRMYRFAQHTWTHIFLAWFRMTGFSFIGFSAFLGFLRFGYFFPRRQHSVQDWHIYFSPLGSIVGLPMLAASFTQRTEWQNLCWMFLVISIISTLLHCIEILHITVRDFCAAISIIFILMTSLFMEFNGRINKYSLLGCVCFIFTIIVSDQGRGVMDIKNIDIFHFLLCFGVCLFAEGLLL